MIICRHHQSGKFREIGNPKPLCMRDSNEMGAPTVSLEGFDAAAARFEDAYWAVCSSTYAFAIAHLVGSVDGTRGCRPVRARAS